MKKKARKLDRSLSNFIIYLWRVYGKHLMFAGLVLYTTSAHALDQEQIEVAKVVAAEACGEGTTGMRLVLNVIQNRAKAWNKSMFQIVSQKNQFYGYTASNKERLYRECRSVVDSLIANANGIPDATDGALFFRQPSEPEYSWHGEETLRYGNHIFHKEKR